MTDSPSAPHLTSAAEQLKHIFALIRDANIFEVNDFIKAVSMANDSKTYPKEKFSPKFVQCCVRCHVPVSRVHTFVHRYYSPEDRYGALLTLSYEQRSTLRAVFDKYAKRDEGCPAGAMGRKELSQLSKDSGSARIDSAYYRDTCEALRAEPDVGLSCEHLALLYIDNGAWAATLEGDYKKIFGTRRVKSIAPPAEARCATHDPSSS